MDIDPTIDERGADGRPCPLDAEPCHVRLTLATRGLHGALSITPAERGPPLATGRLARAALVHDLAGDLDAPGLATLLYLAVQRARVWRRSVVTSADPRLAHALLNMSERAPGGPWAEPVDRAAHRLWAAAARPPLAARFVDEAVASLRRHARAFADNAWCRAVVEARLGREQYLAMLANTHQYVRYTPRLLARAIAISDDEDLRDHFTRHFRGEQKHDRLLESDLRYLGADLEFVLRAMVPSPATGAFMAAQESMIAFYQDPIRFLAVPFVAEGIVSHVDPRLFEHLAANIRRWGYPEPARAMRFLLAHVREDGGDDGHWAQILSVLARHLRDDLDQRRFLAVLHLAADAFTRSYDDHADDFDLLH